MATIRIATTRSRDLQALVTAGQSVVSAWSALVTLLGSRLSPAHAALLAEPVPNPARGETDWYTEAEGAAVPLASLPPMERQTARALLDRQVSDIAALAGTLRTSRDPNDRPFADLLSLATRIPTEGSIYVRDGRPVLVAWGHAPSGADARPVELRRRQAGAPVPMAILAAPPPSLLNPVERAFGRWTWGLLAGSVLALLLALFILLRDPLGWFDLAPPECRVADGQIALLADLRERSSREGVLRGMLADMSRDAGRRRQQCPPVQPPPPPPPPPRPQSDDAKRAEERGGKTGKLQIILAWESKSDLDLHVICPSGEEIKFDRREACGGRLDVDANGMSLIATDRPVENVYFTTPGPGTYKIIVDAYELRPTLASDTRFRVTVKREGQEDQVFPGVARAGQHRQVVTQVDLAPP
jgi:hypothetical protein